MSEEKNNKWEMPKPVFKSSDGSLPRSLEETISTSFMANADTIEIDEDDDILGIMDTPFNFKSYPNLKVEDEEPILEDLPELKTEAAPAIEAEHDHTADVEVAQPIAVTATETVEKAKAKSAESNSNFFFYLMLAIIVAIGIGAFFYISQNKH